MLVDNVHWGMAPTWVELRSRDPGRDARVHRRRDRLEPRRGGARPRRAACPNAYKLVAGAVFAIYFTLPSIALSALPVYADADGEYVTLLGLPPEEGGYANDPVLGLVENLGLEGGLLDATRDLRRRARRDDPLHRHERRRDRRLADHVRDGELPAAAGASSAGCTRASGRRGCRSSSSPASSRSSSILPGETKFLGTMYSFGATLSFTVAHASLVACAYREPDAELRLPRAPEPPRRAASTGRSSRSSAGSATGISWLVIVVQNAATRWAGLGWLAFGLVVYTVYRRRFVHAPLDARRCARPRRARPVAGARVPARSLVPVVDWAESEEALVAASRLAAERGAPIVVVHVIEVPLDLPLDATWPRRRRRPTRCSTTRRRSSSATASRVVTRLLRARAPAAAIVEEAVRRERRARRARRAAQRLAGAAPIFGAHRRLRAEATPRAA